MSRMMLCHIDPLFIIFYASETALSSWTIEGEVVVDNGVRYPFLSGSWYICGESPSSSISRSFRLNEEQIDIYYPVRSQLQVETIYTGDIEIEKTPTCSVSSTTILANKTNYSPTASARKTYLGRFLIFPDDIDMTLTIFFLNETSCVKDLFISIWNRPRN